MFFLQNDKFSKRNTSVYIIKSRIKFQVFKDCSSHEWPLFIVK